MVKKMRNETGFDWVAPAKKACRWFIETIGEEEWVRRRKGVVDYFKSQERVNLTEADVQTSEAHKLYQPIAVHDDWMAWYMYLMESLVERPGVDEPFQAGRISPFFAAIGRRIDLLKQVKGIEERLKVLLNQQQNQPDSTLFELLVASHYLRNGWTVCFLKEDLSKQTPDLEVTRDGKTFWVECKRLAKVPEFAEQERAEWLKRFRHLTNALRILEISAHVEVVFQKPIADTDEIVLGQMITTYFKTKNWSDGDWVSNGDVNIKVKRLDIAAINKVLDEENPRQNSPSMIKVIVGSYEMHGNYTQLIDYKQLTEFGPDDGLHVLNKFCNAIYAAYSAKYKCIAPESIDKKAKDVRKTLSKAVKQIPTDGAGIIHIGYETVSGPEVEVIRQKKTKETVDSFKFNDKNIEAIYCHAIQPLIEVGGFECAETTLYFEKRPGRMFSDTLLLDPPNTTKRDSTHWEEDLNNFNS
jgi:hypothetical protein